MRSTATTNGVWRVLTLIVIATAIGTVWLTVLPRVAQWQMVRERIERIERAGIDPGATFYTELGEVRGVSLHREGDTWVTRPLELGE